MDAFRFWIQYPNGYLSGWSMRQMCGVLWTDSDYTVSLPLFLLYRSDYREFVRTVKNDRIDKFWLMLSNCFWNSESAFWSAFSSPFQHDASSILIWLGMRYTAWPPCLEASRPIKANQKVYWKHFQISNFLIERSLIEHPFKSISWKDFQFEEFSNGFSFETSNLKALSLRV